MKVLISVISFCLITVTLNAQGNYKKRMQKAFSLWETQQIEEASNLFEAIAVAEKENWVPYYYVACINITSSFKIEDRNKINTQLAKAHDNLSKASRISKNNPEIMVLQALLYTSKMLENPRVKSEKLAPMIVGIYEKATAIAPNNPRVKASYAEWKLGKAKFLKADTTLAHQELKKSLLLFKNDTSKVPFAPTWGKHRVETLIAQSAKK